MRNLLLRSLPPRLQALLETHLVPVRCDKRKRLVTANEPFDLVYFLGGGVASMVAQSGDGGEREVGLTGREGLVPVAAILGAETSPHDTYVQVDGAEAMAIPAPVLRDLLGAHQSLREALQRYAVTFLVQIADTAVTNGYAPVEQRLARWLLMYHDRLDGGDLELTHDFIGLMLGVRRSSVTVSLHVLEGAGAIRSTRGLVTLLDRDKLVEFAGETYGRAEEEYRRLVGPFPAG